MKYEVIVFDLDDTLIDNLYSVKGAYQYILNQKGLDYTDEAFMTYFEFDKRYWREVGSGEIMIPKEYETTDDRVKWARATKFMRYFPGMQFEEAVRINDEYIRALSIKIRAIDGARELLSFLKHKRI